MEIDVRLQLIEATLACLENESLILASEDDAQFFRKALLQKRTEKRAERTLNAISTIHKTYPSLPIKAPPIKVVEKRPPPEKTTAAPTYRTDVVIPHNPLNFQQLKTLFQKLFPQVPIIDEIPLDTRAKKLAKRWETKNKAAPISILHLNEPGKQKKLLIEVTKALDVHFGSAQLIDAETIEKEKQWEAFLSSDDLKVIITCDYTLWQLTDLMRFYRESKEKKLRTLGNIPLLLLPDLSLYLKDPLLKRSLWKAICQKLSM